jgi:hypothetical protein
VVIAAQASNTRDRLSTTTKAPVDNSRRSHENSAEPPKAGGGEKWRWFTPSRKKPGKGNVSLGAFASWGETLNQVIGP